MQNVKAVIQKRMKQLGWGPYDLAKAVSGKVSDQTVYNFVKGEREVSSGKLAHMLHALRLEIRPKE